MDASQQGGGFSGGGQGGGGRQADGRGGGGPGGGPGGGGGKRHKRRRQRPQRPKRRIPSAKESAALDSVGRERMFQQVEGLLRQIRELAEETNEFTEDDLRNYTTMVTTFMTLLEEESEPISERARSEFLRVRDRLTQVLRG